MKLAIVGIGSLGGVLLEVLLAAGFRTADIYPITRGSERSLKRCAQLGLEALNFDSLAIADLIVITVKPQDLDTVAEQLKQRIKPNAVILSMMAGVSCDLLQGVLKHRYVARAMPNLGALVGKSATVYYLNRECSEAQIAGIERVLGVCGESYRVLNEELVDVATAVAGSGPAYLCWLGEQIEEVAVSHGFARDDAHAIVLQTFKGAVAYLEHGQERFSDLRQRVTSPNGTTAAALSVLKSREADEKVKSAVEAALERARELNLRHGN